jgi:aminopeptidase N
MTKLLPGAALLAALLLLQPAASARAAPRAVLPDDVRPVAYRIDFTPDAAHARFAGTVEIDVDVRRPTARIVVDAADLAIDAASLSGEARAPSIAVDERAQTASFAFGHALAPGRRTLTVRYRGRINDQGYGLFRLAWTTPQGPASALYTQFENTDARRFVPCWDEPGVKATFALSAVVPQGLMAVGNMPVAATEALPGGLQRVRFAATPRMSSYLLFFALGDFERVHRVVDGVDVGVVVRRGATASAGFALDTAAALLPWYDRWFGVRYPLPKMDMIGGAGESPAFGAMENWGALFYFERDLLVDPARASEADRRRVFSTIAHEMAHQWFGDLVTMAWWDDLWLNEGFATWMQAKAADALHPQWHAALEALADKQDALEADARPGSHPVVARIVDAAEAEGVFDAITYEKGAQVVRALEAAVGADAFRDGVRRYMRRHAYGNTTSDDLWAALDEGAAAPIAPVARDLVLQAGVPLVTELGARCEDGATVVTLAQGRFAVDPADAAPRRWRVPLAVSTLGRAPVRAIVDGPVPRRVRVPGCGPVVLDPGQAGYLRGRYEPGNLAALTARFDALAPVDQLGLLADTAALARRGDVAVADWMALLARVPAQADPAVLQALVDQLRDLDRLHDGLPTQPAFRAWARTRLQPVFARTGWQAGADDDGLALLRAAVVQALGAFGDPDVVAGARARWARLRGEASSAPGASVPAASIVPAAAAAASGVPSTAAAATTAPSTTAPSGTALSTPAPASDPDGPPTDAAMRDAVLEVVAARADAADWQRLADEARAAADPAERSALYHLLARAQDPALVARALALAVSGEPPVTVAGGMLRPAAERFPGETLAFIRAHWPRVQALLGDGAAAEVVARFFGTADDPALADALGAFAREAPLPASAARSLVAAQALVRDRARVRRERLPEVDRWIAAR